MSVRITRNCEEKRNQLAIISLAVTIKIYLYSYISPSIMKKMSLQYMLHVRNKIIFIFKIEYNCCNGYIYYFFLLFWQSLCDIFLEPVQLIVCPHFLLFRANYKIRRNLWFCYLLPFKKIRYNVVLFYCNT